MAVTSLVDRQLQARRLVLAQGTWFTLVLLVVGLTGAGLLAVIGQTMQPEHAWLWLREVET